ncbi:excalibur calcium-binding domain-containing protein [Streptomyces sp. enrichment culture]|uniref:excalibur calcium-binding domain-containing protein n=1 Tax=Streptomyces sp. enrichment culture TaxID=1795815 RepID=UPI003F57A8A2
MAGDRAGPVRRSLGRRGESPDLFHHHERPRTPGRPSPRRAGPPASAGSAVPGGTGSAGMSFRPRACHSAVWGRLTPAALFSRYVHPPYSCPINCLACAAGLDRDGDGVACET